MHCVGAIGNHTGTLGCADGLAVGFGEDEGFAEDEGFGVQYDPTAP